MEVAEVAVTVDGTWQKRGHSSKIGVVFIISVLTGEILDYEVKSLICHECRAHDHMDKDSEEFKAWKTSHVATCQINHTTSSEDMEASAAVEMFGRSVENLSLKRLRAQRKSKGKDSYSSGAFDLSSKPEITNKKGRKAKSIENSDVLPSTSKGPTNTTRQETAVEITFAEPVLEFVAQQRNVSK